MISQTDYKSICNARIDTLLKEYRKEMTQTHVEFGLLLDELRTLINRGGKRMRPYLSYVGYSG
jgi:geranylgeranyl pyrophosphate synthase